VSDVAIPIQQGWQCPVCGQVYSPSVAACWTDHRKMTVTTTQTGSGAVCTCKLLPGGHLEKTTAICPVHP
jgi:hypothetical protein